jgi:hypothetical protein
MCLINAALSNNDLTLEGASFQNCSAVSLKGLKVKKINFGSNALNLQAGWQDCLIFIHLNLFKLAIALFLLPV